MKIPTWRRAVIKVGSALIAPDGKGCSSKYLLAIARFINECRERGQEIVLVSSGSVAAGRHHFKFNENEPIPVPLKKAMAAVGQTQVMESWSRFFDFPCAQVLMTHGDLRDRERYISIRNSVNTLIEHGIMPIANENDALATDALKVGDNDNLAAMIATVVEADALFICSDIDGLYNQDPNKNKDAVLIPEVEGITQAVYALAGGSASTVGTGGMRTKVEAAEKATTHGIDTYILNGRKGSKFEILLRNENPGTLFHAKKDPLSNKKHWLRHTLIAQGEVFVNASTARALREANQPLLTSGVVDVQGHFNRGDAVLVRNAENTETVAKGVCRYSSHELIHLKGQSCQQIEALYGVQEAEEAIRRDDLMLWSPQ